MKRIIIPLIMLIAADVAQAATTINSTNACAYGANIGWVNARGDEANGVVIGQYVCSGYAWAANLGWIRFGGGSPTNGIRYTNAGANDFGVNHDGVGSLRGYAWGANIGWINFENAGNPRLDLRTGNLSGYAYGANIGWISLSNAQAYVQTDCLDAGPDSDNDLLPDAYEYAHTNTLAALSGLAGHDADGDGATDVAEAGADTDPLDNTDFLRIVSLQAVATTNRVAWNTRPTRLYRLEATNSLAGAGAWQDAGPGLLGPTTVSPMTQMVSGVTDATRFYRIRAVTPLSE